MKKLSRSGFGTIELVLFVVLFLGLAVVGYSVYKTGQDNKQVDSSKAADQTTSSKPSSVAVVAEDNDAHTNWTALTKANVSLPAWRLSMTLPATEVGQLSATFHGGNYDFAPTKLVTDAACIKAYTADNPLQFSVGVEVGQYAANTKAYGQVGNAATSDDETLAQYYIAHKASDGAYFVEPSLSPSTIRKYWKIGDNFYVSSTDTRDVYNGTHMTADCPGISNAFEADLTAAIGTLKAE